VADAPGEVGELTVGARELESQATQLEDLDRLAGEQIERRALLVGEGARLLREDAQRADRDALGRDERARRVEADLRELAGDERIRGEPLVDAGIVDEHVTRILQDDGAHRILARADVRDDAVRRHLMLMRVVDDVDDGSRDPAQCRGQAREARGSARRVRRRSDSARSRRPVRCRRPCSPFDSPPPNQNTGLGRRQARGGGLARSPRLEAWRSAW
jgi:hypothetical protein